MWGGLQGKWRGPRYRRKISPVLENYELRGAAGLALLAVVITSLPLLIAPVLLETGSTFSGFLINPVDGFSYLAKMRQGADLFFEFRLPYAPEPGPGVLLFVYQMILGGISSVFGLPQILTYHAARVLGTFAMLGSSYLLFERSLPTAGAKWAAFVLTIVGSGVGWIALPMGLLPIDLWVPEAIPFLSAYANAHFPLATAALITSVSLILFPKILPGARQALLFLGGLLLALLQPFTVVAIGIVLGVWLAVERLHGAQAGRLRSWAVGTTAFVVGALPMLAYTWGVIRRHPVLSAWNEQNLTPTPSIIEVLLGYGLVLIFAVVGMLLGDVRGRPAGRLLITWAILGFIMLYLPVSLQRRLTLGLFIPLAALAGVGLEAITSTRRRFALLLAATIVLSLPSHLVVIGAGLVAVSRGEAGVVMSESDQALFEWIELNISEDPLILAGLDTGNRLPAYSEVRVLYGHPFETPHSDDQKVLVRELWTWKGDAVLGIQALRAAGVDYAFYGEEEKELGIPSWLPLGELAHREGGSELYKVPER
ncbi:MAG: hypothetical protein ACE5M4_07750 [Anaerolineales bacterium]